MSQRYVSGRPWPLLRTDGQTICWCLCLLRCAFIRSPPPASQGLSSSPHQFAFSQNNEPLAAPPTCPTTRSIVFGKCWEQPRASVEPCHPPQESSGYPSRGRGSSRCRFLGVAAFQSLGFQCCAAFWTESGRNRRISGSVDADELHIAASPVGARKLLFWGEHALQRKRRGGSFAPRLRQRTSTVGCT